MNVIGIDVGGTNTDAVLVTGAGITKTVKVPTRHDDLLGSVCEAIDKVAGAEVLPLDRINLSTTLSTNAIIERQCDEVGLMLIPGPGLSPRYLPFGERAYRLSGYVDHRGREVAPLDKEQVLLAVEELNARGTKSLAVVGKFCTRNPEMELQVAKLARQYGDFQIVSMGHQAGGRLNFPRRIVTAYFNAAVAARQKEFVEAISQALSIRKISCEVYCLKADGGTMPLAETLSRPAETIFSGPAASIMGALTLSGECRWAAIVDMGGTTTDIALVANGSAVFAPDGAEIAGYKTNVRSLFSHSMAVGGDSQVTVEGGALRIGPRRLGPAACFGGDCPTPTDAAAVLGMVQGIDLDRAIRALEPVAGQMGMTVEQTARTILLQVAEQVTQRISQLCRQFINRPVYTVKEILDPMELKLEQIIGIGGPAGVFTPLIAGQLNCTPVIPRHYDVANALGAAAARPTTMVTVHVDTALGYYTVAEAGIRKSLSKKNITLQDIKYLAQEWLERRAEQMGISGSANGQAVEEMEIVLAEEFNVVRGFHTAGKIMEVQAQIKPGSLLSKLNE